MVRFNSVAMPPNTVKTFGKRLYSPLTNLRKGVTNPQENRPYVIGICGGPSSGKSAVAKLIKDKLLPNCTAVILNLIHFYKPIRGNLRRRSRADSMMEDQEKGVEEIKSEIRDSIFL